jgi:hypothetical protein
MLKIVESKERKTLFQQFFKLPLHISKYRLVRYSCHIYNDTGHKIIHCLKYNDMQNIFKNKGVKTAKKPFVMEPKVTNPSIHVCNGC